MDNPRFNLSDRFQRLGGIALTLIFTVLICPCKIWAQESDDPVATVIIGTEDPASTNYSVFDDDENQNNAMYAVNHATQPVTLKLLRDISQGEIRFTNTNVPITFDLNGKVLDTSSGITVSEEVIVTVTDNGTGGTIKGFPMGCFFNKGTLTINGGNIDGYGECSAITNSGTLTINGGTISGYRSGGRGVFNTSSLIINGGTFKADSNTGTVRATRATSPKYYSILNQGQGTLTFNALPTFIGSSNIYSDGYDIGLNNDKKLTFGKAITSKPANPIKIVLYSTVEMPFKFTSGYGEYVKGTDGKVIPVAEVFTTNRPKFIVYANSEAWFQPAKAINGGMPFLMMTMDEGCWMPCDNVKAYLPKEYKTGSSEVTLVELKGVPKGMPVIFGTDDTENPLLPDPFYLIEVPETTKEFNEMTAADVQEDYEAKIKAMSNRFAITDGTKTLADAISGTGVDASEAVILVLANGKFTSVDFSADDLEKKTKAGLLLFVLSKWEYMQIKPSAQPASATLSTRAIGIDFGGETTGIKNVHNVQSESYYDLQGRCIAQPTRKGIYIRNGKKIIIK